MKEPLNFYDKSVIESIPTIYRSSYSNEYCDIIITTSTFPVKTNRGLLSHSSEYFRKFFKSNLTPIHLPSVDLRPFDGNSIKGILDYLCTGKITLDQGNVYKLVEIQDFLGISLIRPILLYYLLSTLDSSNCWSYHDVAERHFYIEVFNKVDHFIRENFLNLISDEGSDFYNVPVRQLLSFFESDFLFVPDHEKLLFGLCRWMAYDPNERLSSIEELLGMVDLTRVTSWRNMEERLASLFFEEEQKRRIKEWASEADEKRKTFPRKPPRKAFLMEVILELGGIVHGEGSGGEDRCVSFVDCLIPPDTRKKVLPLSSDFRQFTVMPSMRRERCLPTTVSTGSSVYVIGGTYKFLEGEVECEVYRLKENAWFELPSLSISFEERIKKVTCQFLASIPPACFADGKLFVYIAPSLYVLSRNESMWNMLDVPKDLRICALVGANGSVYCLGEEYQTINYCVLHRYDPSMGCWTRICDTPMERGSCYFALCIENLPYFKNELSNSWLRYCLTTSNFEWIGLGGGSKSFDLDQSVCTFKGKQVVTLKSECRLQLEQVGSGASSMYHLTDRKCGSLATLLVPVYTKEPI